MAKAKKEEIVPVDMDAPVDIGSFLKDLRKKTESTSIVDSPLATVSDWVDTGEYGLNRIISGSIYRGIPAGRVTVLYGPSGSGKSWIASNCVQNAIEKNKYDIVFLFDSEYGGLIDTMKEKLGDNARKIEHIPLSSIENASVKILQVLSAVEEMKKKNPKFKAMCVLDSLGMLTSEKVLTDANEKDKMTGDMGLSAKLRNAMMRAIITPAAKSNTPFIVINHSYDNPGALHPSKIKEMAGGKGVVYAAHIVVQTDRRLEKEGASNNDGFYKVSVLKAFTVKNRVAKPFQETEMFLDYSKGLKRYFGLNELAMKFGFVIQKGAYYQVPSWTGEKNIRLGDYIDNDEAWNTFLPQLNDKIGEYMRYGNDTSEDGDDESEDDSNLP